MAAEGRSSQVGAERELRGDEWEEKGVWRRVGNKVRAERRQSEGTAKAEWKGRGNYFVEKMGLKKVHISKK